MIFRRFKTQFHKVLGFKPALEIVRRRKIEEKSKKLTSKTLYNSFNESVAVNMACTVEIPQGKMQLNNNDGNDLVNRNTKPRWSQALDNESSIKSQKCSQSDDSESDNMDYQSQFSRVILDMSACSFIDNDGVKTLKTFYDDLHKLNIYLMLARCSGKT